MSDLAKAFVEKEMLRWAVNRTGLTPDELAAKLGTSEARVESWLEGDELPSFRQAQRISAIAQIPFGFLYLPEPPAEQLPIAEFRRLPGARKGISKDVFDLLSDIEFKRDWYREYRLEEGFDPLDYVGRFNISSPIALVASDIRKELSRFSNSLFSTIKTQDRFLDELMKAAEKIGIWVMRSGVVGNNTHRSIPVDSLRGFAIADTIVPIVFLNGQDSKAAQIFTFAHELAHIWIGHSSIEFGDLSRIVSDGDPEIEKRCNSIAAELLVPSNEFAAKWIIDSSLTDQVDWLAENFSVSRIVIARRALEQGFITNTEYGEFYSIESNRWASLRSSRPSGGSYYSTIPVRNGKSFTRAVTREAAIGRLLYREAGQLLGVQPSKVREIYERSVD